MQHELGLHFIGVEFARPNEPRVAGGRCRFGCVIIAIAHPTLVVSAERNPMPGRGVEARAVFTTIIVKIGIAHKSNLRLSHDSWFGKIPLELADGFLVKTALSEKHRPRYFGEAHQDILTDLLLVE